MLAVLGIAVRRLGPVIGNLLGQPPEGIPETNPVLEHIVNIPNPMEVNVMEPNPHDNQLNGHVSYVRISPPPNSVADQDDHQETPPADLQSELKISLGLIAVSAGSLVAVIVVIFGEKKISLAHPVVSQAFASLSLISLISDIILLLLTLKRPNISYLLKIVRFTLCVSLVSLYLAYTWAVFVLL
ncbi:uncharacterized protein LOC113353672 [Papaver somniferum]|nr:uncharacterized protein LOC113353672 [Papaver somniferum]